VTSALGESRVRPGDGSPRAQPRDFSKPRRAGSRFLGSSRFDGRTACRVNDDDRVPDPTAAKSERVRALRAAYGVLAETLAPGASRGLTQGCVGGTPQGRKKTTLTRRLEKSRRIAWRPSGWRANPPAPATIDPTPAGFLRRAVVLKLAICEVLGLNLREFVCNPGAAGQIIHRHCGSVHRPFQEDGLGITL
jgi:hypothetical protein